MNEVEGNDRSCSSHMGKVKDDFEKWEANQPAHSPSLDKEYQGENFKQNGNGTTYRKEAKEYASKEKKEEPKRIIIKEGSMVKNTPPPFPKALQGKTRR